MFVSIEHLVGAANNEDIFNIDPGTILSGGLDGGIGGFDSLVLGEGSEASVIYMASGPDSGDIQWGESLIAYIGLEPITDNSNAAARIFMGTPEDDVILLTSGPSTGILTLQSETSTFESITFPNPTVSLSIEGGGGNDVFIIENLDPSLTITITLDGGMGSNEVIVSRDRDITLTNSTLQILGERTLNLIAIDKATLLAGPSANQFDASDFTGTVVFKGLGFDDYSHSWKGTEHKRARSSGLGRTGAWCH